MKKEPRNFYLHTFLRQWFSEQLENNERIERLDLDRACAEIAIYDVFGGGTGCGKAVKKACRKIKTEARIYNRILSQRLKGRK